MIKEILRPLWRRVYPFIHTISIKHRTFQVPVTKLLRGGENGIRAAKYAELTNDFLRPSTSVFHGPHVNLLQLYDKMGDEVLEDKVFHTTAYYKNAYECMRLTGSYFYDQPEKIKTLAERFIRQYKGEKLNLPQQPGQSDANQPIWVRPIKFSSCYEVIDGNHRLARSIMDGVHSVPVFLYEKEPALTPLQQLLLDCLWINKQKWLYQPVNSPELKDEWILIRQSTDRLEKMVDFLKTQDLLPSKKPFSYLDIGSSYGWFVKEFEKLGFSAFGLERDPFGMEIGFKMYDLNKNQIIHDDIVRGLEKLIKNKRNFDVVSCLSVLHHFALNKSSTAAEDFIKMIDKITGKILFLDTGEEHETAFEGTLNGWNPVFIQQWLLENTTFKHVIPLGKDNDRKPPFEGYYNRTLFACVK